MPTLRSEMTQPGANGMAAQAMKARTKAMKKKSKLRPLSLHPFRNPMYLIVSQVFILLWRKTRLPQWLRLPHSRSQTLASHYDDHSSALTETRATKETPPKTKRSKHPLVCPLPLQKKSPQTYPVSDCSSPDTTSIDLERSQQVARAGTRQLSSLTLHEPWCVFAWWKQT